jgi:membrane protein DedA with SNARE-associated domain
MPIEQLLTSYGAIAVFVGTFFEGETIVILVAFAAHQGYLPLWEVIAAAFAGAYLGDQFYFYLGRHKGQDFLARKPAWMGHVQKATRLLERFHVWIILAIRYLYGLRMVLCFTIGMSPVSRWQFVVLDALGVAIWAVLTSLAGYYVGRAMEVILDDAKKYELAAAGLIIAAGCIVWGLHRYRQHRR